MERNELVLARLSNQYLLRTGERMESAPRYERLSGAVPFQRAACHAPAQYSV